MKSSKNPIRFSPTTIFLVFFVVFGTASAYINYYLYTNRDISKKETTTLPDRTTYPLLASRIFVDNPNDNILNFAALRKDIREYFAQLNINYSFYAEYLPTGTSIKVNQDNPMAGASLLKVPVIMNLFYGAEKGEIDINARVAIQEGDIDKRSGTLWQKGVGYQLSITDAARYAIVDSDNTAINMLIGVASGKFDLFQKAIDELDVDLTAASSSQTNLGAQGYSSILKCLYLSCFNTYDDSQKILEWMVESNSPPRLRASIPPSIQVAHKYGTSGGESESDCGIVYIPKRPYIICVMIGAEPDRADQIIQEVSKKVYDYITNAP